MEGVSGGAVAATPPRNRVCAGRQRQRFWADACGGHDEFCDIFQEGGCDRREERQMCYPASFVPETARHRVDPTESDKVAILSTLTRVVMEIPSTRTEGM